jgi:transposase
MTNRTVIAADIAKTVSQCVEFRNGQQVKKNRSYKCQAFEQLLRTHKPMRLVMETCGGAQHWARLAERCDGDL